MKKLLVLLTVMVAIVGLTASAYAQAVCTNCKGAVRYLTCPTAAGQGGACAINMFDWDDNLTNAGIATMGYCAPQGALDNYRAIMAVCNCSNAAWFVPGREVGIKQTILVNGVEGELGAYFSDVGAWPAGYVGFADYTTQALACAGAAFVNTFDPTAAGFAYFDAASAPAVPVAPLTTACVVPAGARATSVKSPSGAVGLGYTILAGDGQYWWVDVHPMRIDPTVAKAGDRISVRIDLFDSTAANICPECITPICSCTIEVGIVCCAVPAVSTLLTYPYFTGLDENEYWNGLVIINPTGAAGSCALTAYEQDGTVATSSTGNINAYSMFVNVLSAMTWADDGSGTGGSPCWVAANCNFGGALGFFMLSNEAGNSMGTNIP